MTKDALVRRLRPFLSPRFQCLQHARASQPFSSQASRLAKRPAAKSKDTTHDYEKRVGQLEALRPRADWYPRLDQKFSKVGAALDLQPTEDNSRDLQSGELRADKEYRVIGRVVSRRNAGAELTFLDLETNEVGDSLRGSAAANKLQVVLELQHLQRANPSLDRDACKQWRNVVRRGDVYAVVGNAYRSDTGQLSLKATELPILMSPSLHQIPVTLDDPETRARHPHVDMLVNPEVIQTLRVRHVVERAIGNYLESEGFTKVVTPLLAAQAGGAAARPFETEATELAGEKLQLRIAPELWLKRLIVGGMHRVYEIGPAFRNEGVDGLHNPEFNICEFYRTYATLDDLMRMTEAMLYQVEGDVRALKGQTGGLGADSALPESLSLLGNASGRFQQIEFLPGLATALGQPVPDLSSPTAQAELTSLLQTHKLHVASEPTLPRLLDTLAAHFLESESLTSRTPIFITHHPACMSPLAKHFDCPTTGQRVAARAELFIRGMEIANMYEEENSPFAQAEKFAAQVQAQSADGAIDPEAMLADEGFVRALEWGMPPTGGWGCGMDRLVMLFAGRQRLADVFPFGSLRNVVALGKDTGRRS